MPAALGSRDRRREHRADPLEPQVDIVGVCGMGVQFPRQQELLAYYRSRGHYVVAGGSYASLCPEQ